MASDFTRKTNPILYKKANRFMRNHCKHFLFLSWGFVGITDKLTAQIDCLQMEFVAVNMYFYWQWKNKKKK